MRDPYDVLGVGRKANAEEIKKAFRKRAKALHPDANANDPKAASKFAELNAAYEILGEAAKRAQFDRGEIDAEGKPRFQGFEGFGAGPGGPGGFGGFGARPGGGFGAGPGGTRFERFEFGPEGFRRGGTGSGPAGLDDLFADLLGGRHGGGRPGFEPGRERGSDVTAALTVTLAEAAKGARRRLTLPTGRDVEVAIPAGLASGQTIRLKGQGQPNPLGGAAGDALVTVTVAPHPTLRVEGADLHTDLAVPLADAVLGGKARVETLDGAVELTIPPMSSGGKTFRLRGRGLPLKGGGAGDLYAAVRIVLPQAPDAELSALMAKRRAEG